MQAQVLLVDGNNMDTLILDYQKSGTVYGEKPVKNGNLIQCEVKAGSNYRCEVRLNKSWPIRFPEGTIRTYGVRMKFNKFENVTAPVSILQAHDGRNGEPAQWFLRIANQGNDGGAAQNELSLFVAPERGTSRYITHTDFIVREGDLIDFIVQVKYARRGFIKLWIGKNGGEYQEYGFNAKTVFYSNRFGGNFKTGIYGRNNTTHSTVNLFFNAAGDVDPMDVDPRKLNQPEIPDKPDPPGIEVPCPKGMKLVKLVVQERNGGEYSKIITCVPINK